MAELLNRLPVVARWILTVVVLVVLIAFLALFVSQLRAEAGSIGSSWLWDLLNQTAAEPCLRDAADFDQPEICNAEDVQLSALELIEGPETCTPGEQIEVKLGTTLQAGAHERYDVGLYIAVDGGNAVDRGSSCFRDYLHPVSSTNGDLDLSGGFGPFHNGEMEREDTCGDIQGTAEAFYYLNENEPITIICADSDGNGIADVGTVISWDNNDQNDCSDESDAVPDQTSKCRDGSIDIAGLLIPLSARLELAKSLSPAEDPGLLNLYIDDTDSAEGVGNLGTTGVVTVTAGTNVEPGATHQVSETAGADTVLPDYAISLACVYRGTTDPAGSGSGPGPHAVSLQPDDDIVCTFTNTRRQNGITIRKETEPADISADFPFASTAAPASFSLAHGEEQAFAQLQADTTYVFTETVPAGWDLKQITCSGQESSSIEYGETDVSVLLAPEETILCTLVDGPVPSITVTKTADPISVAEPGGLVTYTVVVENDSVAGVDIELTGLDDDPYGDVTDPGNTDIVTSTCELTQTIPQGDSYRCTFQADVAGSAGDMVTDTVTATAHLAALSLATDAEIVTAQADNGVAVQASDLATVTITIAPPILITVTKTADPEVVYAPTGTVKYWIDVTNGSGPGVPVTLTALTDDIYGDPTQVANTEVANSTCALGEGIQPGDTYQCSFEAVVEGEVGIMVTDTITATAIDQRQREVTGRDDATVTLVTEPPDTGGDLPAPIIALGLAMLGASLLLAGTAVRVWKAQPRR